MIRKIFRMLPAVAPMDFRMAISFRFSTTAMLRVLTIPKEATTTIMTRIINIVIFSSRRAAKRDWYICIQVRA